jgi:small subunit ribosomal protein S24e
MKVEIKNKNENKLLHRTEMTGTIIYEGATPTRQQVRSELAKQLKVKEDVVVSKFIESNFGGNTANFEAFVYDTPEHLQEVETKKFIKQTEKKEEPKTEVAPAAPAEAPKEAPAAEKSE